MKYYVLKYSLKTLEKHPLVKHSNENLVMTVVQQTSEILQGSMEKHAAKMKMKKLKNAMKMVKLKLPLFASL